MKKPAGELRTAFGVYGLYEQIGQGGVGVVFRATDDEGHEHAIKILDPEKATPRRLRRFQNEILFGSRNEHPNVIRIEDHGATDVGPFYVMPFMPSALRRTMRAGLKGLTRCGTSGRCSAASSQHTFAKLSIAT
jgi:serine/threonine protein kinase